MAIPFRPVLRLVIKPLTLALLASAATSHAELVQHGQSASTYPDENRGVSLNKDKMQQCAQVLDNAARLACFDKVVAGETLPTQKAPLDLVKTVSASIQEGKAVPVLADKATDNTPSKQAVPSEQQSDSESLAESLSVSQPTIASDREILQNVGVTQDDVASYTPLSVLYDIDRNDPKGLFTLRPHQPMYIMPLWYSFSPNRAPASPTHAAPDNYPDMQNLDSKMQISFKTKMLQDVFETNADVWFGYTQQFYWQVYNESDSRLFRSSDYQPEVFITQPVKAALPKDGRLRVLGAGLVHQSNGQADPLSRSWNRGYVMAGMEWGKLTLVPRAWFIFPSVKDNADNEDIGDYMGYGDMRFLYDLGEKQSIGGLVRYNPFENKGAIALDYARPIIGGMKAYLQLFHGYGENIQDYNHKDTNIGLGIMFNDFSGL